MTSGSMPRDRPGAQRSRGARPRARACESRISIDRRGAVVDAGGVARGHACRPAWKTGRSSASCSSVVARGCSSTVNGSSRRGGSTGTICSAKRPCLDGRRGALLAAQRERVLLLARDVVTLRDLLGRDAHRYRPERIGQQRERPVDRLARAEPPAVARAVLEERLTAHRLVPAGDDDARLAREDLLRAAHDRLQAGGAEAVDVHRRRRRREPARERAAPRVVGVRPDLARPGPSRPRRPRRPRCRRARSPRGCRRRRDPPPRRP